MADMKNLMSLYVAFLRGLYQVHQNNHWLAKGNDFYGNHLLFERLYSATQEDTDAAAEKTIGLFGDLNTLPEAIAKIVNKFKAENYDNNTLVSSLKAEHAFLELSKEIYSNLDEDQVGLDDLIASITNKHESHIYLLTRALDD